MPKACRVLRRWMHFRRAIGEFVVEDLGLVVEPAAPAAAGRSLDSCGLLLLGEMHGVRENPLVIRAVMQAFGLTRLALEWPDELAPWSGCFSPASCCPITHGCGAGMAGSPPVTWRCWPNAAKRGRWR